MSEKKRNASNEILARFAEYEIAADKLVLDRSAAIELIHKKYNEDKLEAQLANNREMTKFRAATDAKIAEIENETAKAVKAVTDEEEIRFKALRDAFFAYLSGIEEVN